MSSDPALFWDRHPGISTSTPFDDDLDFLVAQLRVLAAAASDRAEMHSILAQQRDSWNKLFQHTLTAASFTACILAALNGAQPASTAALAAPAAFISAVSAAMMSLVNTFQPSQLAEEQRTATRLFRKLANEIDQTLRISDDLRQPLPAFLRDSRRRLRAIDKAFPMPLTPGGLQKFPTVVRPPVLITPLDDQISTASPAPTEVDRHSGWDKASVEDLQRVADILRNKDIKTYTSWATNLVKVNKCFAIAAPAFAGIAAILNILSCIPAAALSSHHIALVLSAGLCSAMAAFASSFSHDMQLGMVFELYRNSAGYYADIDASIREALASPVKERENGALFRQRVAYQLGHFHADGAGDGEENELAEFRQNAFKSSSPTEAPESVEQHAIVPSDATSAGTLF